MYVNAECTVRPIITLTVTDKMLELCKNWDSLTHREMSLDYMDAILGLITFCCIGTILKSKIVFVSLWIISNDS